jgi:heptosyltransferase-2
MKIAVFLPNWIGDAVMATPALRALREQFAGARLIGVMKPYVAGVLDGSPWLDAAVAVRGQGLSAAWQLRRERPKLAVLFPNSFRSALLAWLGGCRERIGYVRYGRGPLLTQGLEPVRDKAGRLKPSPVIDAYNRLAEAAGCPRPSHRMELFTTGRDEAAADRAWGLLPPGDGEVVCLNPGAAFGSAKYWPAEHFAVLARELADRRGARVLVVCGPAERKLARQIATLAGRPGVVALSDMPLSLGLTKACIRRCDLLVTTDSGPRHFGVAFDRPTLTLFGPTHIAWTETYHARSVHLQQKVECGPCQRRTCPLDHRCMTGLSPSRVLTVATELLERFPSTAARKAG